MPGLLNLLHEVSPYVDHDLAAHPGDMQGWGANDTIFEMVIRALRPAVIVEVGTWKGASAIHMAQIARRLNLATQIVCVDTWLGSPEHFLGMHPEWRASLRMRSGYPQLYFTFLTNVIEHRVSDVIIPLPATSENGAAILKLKNIRPQFVYVDAAHEYGAVKRDIELYWELLTDDGVMLGDDYARWPGVTQAVDEFSRQNKVMLAARPGKFLLAKDPAFLRHVEAGSPGDVRG